MKSQYVSLYSSTGSSQPVAAPVVKPAESCRALNKAHRAPTPLPRRNDLPPTINKIKPGEPAGS